MQANMSKTQEEGILGLPSCLLILSSSCKMMKVLGVKSHEDVLEDMRVGSKNLIKEDI